MYLPIYASISSINIVFLSLALMLPNDSLFYFQYCNEFAAQNHGIIPYDSESSSLEESEVQFSGFDYFYGINYTVA
uniref:Uncharacterized protein n=1 Tax=Glossina palpalis gambiensis TaxID=67801 RepID=A0A1B0B758_9MUSC